MKNDLAMMRKALEGAKKAFDLGEVPVGALLMDSQGEVSGEVLSNNREELNNPLGHAEVNCLLSSQDQEKRKNWRLSDFTLYVTLEPCLMCLGAMIQARIKRLVFGAYDAKGGSLSLGYHPQRDPRLNHHFQITGGFWKGNAPCFFLTFFKKDVSHSTVTDLAKFLGRSTSLPRVVAT